MTLAAQPADEPVPVDARSFVRAETDTYFDTLLALSGGLGRWHHARLPISVDEQTVIRMNRDTLYSSAIVDITAGAELTMPDANGRYQTAMIVNQDHYINRVFDRPGTHQLSIDKFDTPYVLVGVRILVDPTDPRDLEAVTVLQDRPALSAQSATPFSHPVWDHKTLTATRNTLLELARASVSNTVAFGTRQQTDPIAHLLSTASGWGGLPAEQATYLGVEPRLPAGHYSLTVDKVPVRAFCSVSVYNAAGFFEKNDLDRYSVNSVTATANPDASVTVNFGGDPDLPNQIPIMDGWNYVVRLYQPERAILDGSWTFPAIDRIAD